MEPLPAADVHMLGRDWLRSGEAVIRCVRSIRTAPRRGRARYAKLLSATLLRNFTEQLSPDDWSAAASARIHQLLLTTALVLFGCAPKEQYWQVALQSIQTAARFFDPGERVVAKFPQHHIAGLRVKIAQQCRDHNQLQLMSGTLRGALLCLPNSTPNREFLAARCGCAHHALQQQQRVVSSEAMPKVQCCIALLQLFYAINSMWPGQAGLLATPEGQEAAGPAFKLAVVLLEQAAGLDRQSKGQTAEVPAAAAAVKAAIGAAALLFRQLSNRMHHSRQSMRSSQEDEQHEGFEQQLLDSPAVLHMLLLLADMRLQQLISNSSISSTSHGSHSTSTDGAGATAVQEYHKQLLLSFRGLPDHLWQGSIPAEAAAAANPQQSDLLSVLSLLQAALGKLKARCVSDGGAAIALPNDPRDFVSCALLPRLMSALTHTAQQQWQAGSYEVAAAALEAILEASNSLELIALSCREHCEEITADSATATAGPVMHLAFEQQQLMPDLLQDLVSCMEVIAHQASAPSAAAGSTSEAPDSCSIHMTDTNRNPSNSLRIDSSSGPDGLQAKLLGVLLIAAGRASDTAFGDLPSIEGASECSSSVAVPHMQLTAARVVECSLRTVAQQVQSTAGGTQHAELISGIEALLDGDLCTVGVPTKLPNPAPFWKAEQPFVPCHEIGSSCLVQQTTAASAAQSVEACGFFMEAAHKGLFALLLSSLKLARPAGITCVPDKVENIVSVLINDAVKASQQATQGAALTSLSEVQAAPWLVLMARCMILDAEALQRSAVLSITSSQSSAAESATRADGDATAECSTSMAVFDTTSLLWSIQRICTCFGSFEAAACCAQAAPAAAAGLQQELTVFWQSLEQQLMPELQLAVKIVLCTAAFHSAPQSDWEALQQHFSSNPLVSELVGQLQTAGTALAQNRILSSSFIAQLPQKVKTAAEQLCVLLPVPLCCNNPDCSNMSRQTELQLVGGKSCVCAGCEVARYCGRECQAAHWQAHKRVCKMIKKSSLATATTARP